MSRVDLIALANAAADANASNTPLPPSINEAAGQRFELFLPFGCDGPAPKGSEASLQWRYDSEASTLRVRAQPTSWNLQDWWQAPPPELEALEGFWITRPWSSQEICPRSDVTSASRGLDPVTAPRQTLGVAQLVTEDTPRQLRRGGRAYEIVTRVPPEALRLDAGLRIRLRGRVVRFPQSDAVRCAQPGGLEQRPVCLIGVTFDEVAIDNPATLDVLAVWAPTVANPSHPD